MAKVKITELPGIGVPQITGDDIFPVVDAPDGGVPITKKLTVSNLFEVAPVKSVAGKNDGDITLDSTDLTNSSDITLNSALGSVSIFNSAFNQNLIK